MYASVVAETPPVISSITPRSQVTRETGTGKIRLFFSGTE